jgi:hypothetical protein
MSFRSLYNACGMWLILLKDIDLAIQAQDPIDDQGDVEWEGSF